MSLDKMFLVVNPCSGRAKMKNHLLSIVQIFSAAGYEVTVYPTKSVGDAARAVGSLKSGEYDIVVCCGGDGTLNETITGMINSNLNCKVGYIPSGTLNEWSGSLGIAKNVTRAANDILKMNTSCYMRFQHFCFIFYNGCLSSLSNFQFSRTRNAYL